VFGSRSSPKIFDQLAIAVCWIATNNYRINNILHLLDDFLTIDSPNFDGDRTMAVVSLIFNRLKIPLAPHKTLGPTTQLVFLGITLDTVKMEASLPDDKLNRIRTAIQLFITRKTCTKRELLSLLGHLNFACCIIPAGRSFVGYLLERARSAKKLHHHIVITGGCCRDLIMWQKFLTHWNGRSLFQEPFWINSGDLDIYTDASSTAGFGGYFAGRWFSGTWPSELKDSANQSWSMALLELYPIVVAVSLWGGLWSEKKILFHCDNTATVAIIEKGRSPVSLIMMLMRRLTWESLLGNFVIRAIHIPGYRNTVADALSRFQFDKFHTLAPQACPTPEECPCFANLVMP